MYTVVIMVHGIMSPSFNILMDSVGNVLTE